MILATFCFPPVYIQSVKHIGRDNKLLWIVDGVEVKDSVADYSIDELSSDSGAVITALYLKIIHRLSDLKSITLYDSLEAAKRGYADCKGVVNVETNIKNRIIFIVNGLVHQSTEVLNGGMLLDTANVTKIIDIELSNLEKYHITDVKIIGPEELPKFSGERYTLPIVTVTTELPCYTEENLAGIFEGRKNRKRYNLQLNQDSTYTLSHNKSNFCISGRWTIDMDKICLTSDADNVSYPEFIAGYDTLTIKSINEIILRNSSPKSNKVIKFRREKTR